MDTVVIDRHSCIDKHLIGSDLTRLRVCAAVALIQCRRAWTAQVQSRVCRVCIHRRSAMAIEAVDHSRTAHSQHRCKICEHSCGCRVCRVDIIAVQSVQNSTQLGELQSGHMYKLERAELAEARTHTSARRVRCRIGRIDLQAHCAVEHAQR